MPCTVNGTGHASWASGAAQAAQFVRIILCFCGELLGLRGGFDSA